MSSTVEISAYEDRRKSQNREAQRRYRQKLRRKKRSSLPSSDELSGPTAFGMQLLPGMQQMAFGNASSGYDLHRECHPECGEALTIDYGNAPQHSEGNTQARIASGGVVSLDFADASWSHTPSMPASISRSSRNLPSGEVPLSPTSLDRHASEMPANADNSAAAPSLASRKPPGPDGTSVAQTKLISKACGMVEELRKLYDLGVELELLHLETNLPVYLAEIERLIHLSGQRMRDRSSAADNGSSI
ncbi:hypothetical protein NLG97_g10918 [Lecanicillium saksenae]|uniref:Uncharacterized protein n=1 Tax=Lecanicillium saksenae TaxID=468837 RepID=A0ACC1QEA6_9HYPO|nr:hypothetical protein NLG97_g10918 [Lecanicillium saksenae]